MYLHFESNTYKHMDYINSFVLTQTANHELNYPLQMQEKEIYNQRQSILEEIEAVRQREAQIKREGEVISRYSLKFQLNEYPIEISLTQTMPCYSNYV